MLTLQLEEVSEVDIRASSAPSLNLIPPTPPDSPSQKPTENPSVPLEAIPEILMSEYVEKPTSAASSKLVAENTPEKIVAEDNKYSQLFKDHKGLFDAHRKQQEDLRQRFSNPEKLKFKWW